MKKARNKRLMEIAEQILRSVDWKCPLFIDSAKTSIYDSYNGQVAALGVSILMIGLKPTMAVYYQDEPKAGEAHRRCLLDVIARMIHVDKSEFNFTDAEVLTRYVLGRTDDVLKEEILDCSVALKQVIRTYKLEKYEK